MATSRGGVPWLSSLRADSGGGQGWSDGHPVHGGQLFKVEAGQYGDISDEYLECSERAQWGSVVECARAGYVRELRQRG